jgi:hypothetical protein
LNPDDAADALTGVWLLVEYRDRASPADPASAPFLFDDPPERLFRVEGDTLFICDEVTWRRRLVRAR